MKMYRFNLSRVYRVLLVYTTDDVGYTDIPGIAFEAMYPNTELSDYEPATLEEFKANLDKKIRRVRAGIEENLTMNTSCSRTFFYYTTSDYATDSWAVKKVLNNLTDVNHALYALSNILPLRCDGLFASDLVKLTLERLYVTDIYGLPRVSDLVKEQLCEHTKSLVTAQTILRYIQRPKKMSPVVLYCYIQQLISKDDLFELARVMNYNNIPSELYSLLHGASLQWVNYSPYIDYNSFALMIPSKPIPNSCISWVLLICCISRIRVEARHLISEVKSYLQGNCCIYQILEELLY